MLHPLPYWRRVCLEAMNPNSVSQLQMIESAVPLRSLYAAVTHDRQLVMQLIDQWHSWRNAPQGWRVAFLFTDGVCIFGVSTFGRPVARLEDQETTLEHTRMALAPNAPRCSATRFMALSRKWIRDNMPEIKRLISYVPFDRFTGVTYRVDNWRTAYAYRHTTHSWTNRSGHQAVENHIRTKFERVP